MNRLKHLLFPLCAVLALRVFVVEAQEPPDIPHTNWIRNLSWSPDGGYIAVARQNGLIEVVRASDQQTHITLATAGSDLSYAVAWSPDGIAIAGGVDDRVYIWDAETGTTEHILEGHLGKINALDWHPSSTKLASLDPFGRPNVYLWDISQVPPLLEAELQTWVSYDLAWSPNGNRLAVSREGEVRVVSTSGQVLGSIPQEGFAIEVAWHPTNENLIASANHLGTIFLLSAGTWEVVHTLNSHTDWVSDLEWNTTGTLLASGGGDGIINFWTVDGELVDTLQSADSVYAIAWHPDGSQLAYGGAGVNETVQIVAAPEVIEIAQ